MQELYNLLGNAFLGKYVTVQLNTL